MRSEKNFNTVNFSDYCDCDFLFRDGKIPFQSLTKNLAILNLKID